ncbi:YTH domain-containing protein 1-like isoform X3 [Haliotis rubra]|uniref:YTH domain-containing protein 1-like isoform X3 n=1 Tax=Haliotis rubra TaxID=36100 RepID=UPI001EE60CD2|nr:YTH domain-containing protein 1-like isoform X3 [Haliotis rubra]
MSSDGTRDVDAKGGDSFVNVLDDILDLDGNAGEDELTAEINQEKEASEIAVEEKTIVKADQTKKKTVVKRTVAKSKPTTKKVVKKTVVKKEGSANSAVKKSATPSKAAPAKTVKRKSTPTDRPVVSKKSDQGDLAEVPEKVAKVERPKTKVVKKVVKPKAKKEVQTKVKQADPVEEDDIGGDESREEGQGDDSEDRIHLSLSAEESEELRQSGEVMDNHGYDTRSETGSTGEESVASDSEPNTDGEASPKKKKPKHGGKKKRQREISPIEWDRQSEESEENDITDASEESEDDEEKSVKSGEGGKSDSETERRRYASKVKYLFKGARYFLIKSNNHENVALAKAKGVWSTPPQNEAKLNQAYRECNNVILIFSVKESGKFQGFARIGEESTKDHPPIRWVLPPGMSARALSAVFKLDWVGRRELPFTKAAHLHNSWNDNKPVKIGRDGQEIEPRCGEALCKMFPPDNKLDISSIVRKARRSRPLVRPERPRDRPRNPRFNDMARRRRHSRENFYEGPRNKRSRGDFGGRDGFFKDKRMDRGPRGFPGVRRETFLNGSYSDYMREFAHNRPPVPPMAPYGPPPPGYFEPPPSYTTHYDNRAPRDFMSGPNYGDMSMNRQRRDGREPDKRSYEREVNEFLRRTSHGTLGSSRDRERDRDRDRDRERDHDRDRSRERDRRHRDRR